MSEKKDLKMPVFIMLFKKCVKSILLIDNVPCTVGFVNCFLKVPKVYLPCCLQPCCQGRLGELLEKMCIIAINEVFCHLLLIELHLGCLLLPTIYEILWLNLLAIVLQDSVEMSTKMSDRFSCDHFIFKCNSTIDV